MRSDRSRASSPWWRAGGGLALALVLGCGIGTRSGVDAAARPAAQQSVIVQGVSVEAASAAVRQVGGTVTRRLAIINAVAADVTSDQRRALADHSAVERVWDDGTVHAQGPEEGR